MNYYSSTTISLSWAKTIAPAFYHPSARSDYSRPRSSVYFPARVNQVTFSVAILDEGLVELIDEEFYIELKIPSAAANRGVVRDFPYNATVIIRDDDGECVASSAARQNTTRTS